MISKRRVQALRGARGNSKGLSEEVAGGRFSLKHVEGGGGGGIRGGGTVGGGGAVGGMSVGRKGGLIFFCWAGRNSHEAFLKFRQFRVGTSL